MIFCLLVRKKKLESRVKVLQRFAKFSLLEIELLTGRKHQIRRQCQFIDHSVVGDKIYGDFTLNKGVIERESLDLNNFTDLKSNSNLDKKKKNLMLCAKKIIFNKKGKKQIVEADLPEHFSGFLQKYNIIFKEFKR